MAACSDWMPIGRPSPERATASPTYGERVTLRQANFEELATVAAEEGFAPADGILFDLGLSSYQLADSERAFSFRAEGPLDMRFDTSRGIPASRARR